MGGHDRGDSLAVRDAADQPHDLPRGLQVKLAGGLVGEQQPRVVRQGPRYRHPLLLAAGQLIRALPGVPGQAHQVQQRDGAALPGGRVQPGQPHRQAHVLRRGQHRQQPERLEDERDPLAQHPGHPVRAHRRDLLAVHLHPAAGRPFQAADDAQQRGLPRTRPPAQRDKLAPGDRERHPAQRVHFGRAAAVAAGHLLDPHDLCLLNGFRCGAGHASPCPSSGAGLPPSRSWRPCARRRTTGPVARVPARGVRPDPDMVGLQGQQDPVAHAQRLDEVARDLQPPGAVEHRVLLGHVGLLPVLVGRGVAEHLGADPAVPDRYRPADLLGHLLVVGDHQDRHAEVGVGGPQRREHLLAGRGVEFPGGLVGEQHRGLVGQRHADRHALLLPAGHLGRHPVLAVADAQRAEQFGGAALPGPPALGGQAHRQRHVLRRRQVREQVPAGLLPEEAHGLAAVGQALPRAHAQQVVPGHPGPARGGRVQARQDVEQRGLAAARRADERGQLTGLDQQVKPLQSLDLDAGRGVDPDQAVAGDDRVVPEAGARGPSGLLATGELLDGGLLHAHNRLTCPHPVVARRSWCACGSVRSARRRSPIPG